MGRRTGREGSAPPGSSGRSRVERGRSAGWGIRVGGPSDPPSGRPLSTRDFAAGRTLTRGTRIGHRRREDRPAQLFQRLHSMHLRSESFTFKHSRHIMIRRGPIHSNVDPASLARTVPAPPPPQVSETRALRGSPRGGGPPTPVDLPRLIRAPGKRCLDDPSAAAHSDIAVFEDCGWGATLPEHRNIKRKGLDVPGSIVTGNTTPEPSRLLNYRARAAAKFILPPACNMALAFSG